MSRCILAPFYLALGALAALAALAAAPGAYAQAVDAANQAQQQYERDLAVCNSGALAAPAREACVRTACLQLDRARGRLPSEAIATTPDGRATVVAPSGTATPTPTENLVTTPDGRATVVTPR